MRSPGIHHVTAIAGDPQDNLDFYTGLLDLHLVKLTVNFDDAGTYHFYYGDATGRPGTILTFFPWPRAVRGVAGTGMTREIQLAIPPGSISFWSDRLQEHRRPFQGPFKRFDSRCLALEDPDGLQLQLVEDGFGDNSGVESTSAAGSIERPRSPEVAIRGIYSVTLAVANRSNTVRLLTEAFGYTSVGEEDDVLRLRLEGEDIGSVIELVASAATGRNGSGTIHHVAFRARSADEQLVWQNAMLDEGMHVTDVKDRKYFKSIYFRELGGVLFEIATDDPGFAVDEAPDALGRKLQLPPWLEVHRARIEQQLPQIRIPRG